MEEIPESKIINNDGNSVEIIRCGLRKTAENDRKIHRNREFNKLRRTALGVQLSDNGIGEVSWTGEVLVQKGKQLKKKTLGMRDYKQLEVALLQSQENINNFMSIDQILSSIVRDLSSSNPEIQLLALHCCCNIALGGKKHSSVLSKHIGPYLMTQLESRNNPLLEASAWTIGNLCNSGSKEAHEALDNLGCFNRLCSLLKSCQSSIISSISYAVKFYLFGNSSSGVKRESDLLQVTKILSERLSIDRKLPSEGFWLLALLSSTQICRNHLFKVFSDMSSLIMSFLEGFNAETDGKEVIPIIRLLGNLASEPSDSVADLVFLERTISRELSISDIFNKLLEHSDDSVRRETLWLIGNLYNHPSLRVRNALQNNMEFFNFSY